MKQIDVERARIHPGLVHHTMDHYVMDLRDPTSKAATYFTVYSIAYMPEVGTGYVGFIRVHGADGQPSIDVTLAEDPKLGRLMQKRLKRVITTGDTSRGIGTDLDEEPVVATFERLPFVDGRAGYRVKTADMLVEAWWSEASEPVFVAAHRGSFHDARDITGTMISFAAAELSVDGVRVPGAPYPDDWWFRRLGRPFSSSHFSLGDTAIEPAQDWWLKPG